MWTIAWAIITSPAMDRSLLFTLPDSPLTGFNASVAILDGETSGAAGAPQGPHAHWVTDGGRLSTAL
jgi:hypothetical protein